MSSILSSPSVATEPAPDAAPTASPATPRSNGLTDAQVAELLAVAGRRKGDPSMDRLMEEVDKYREQLRQEEIASQEAAARGK